CPYWFTRVSSVIAEPRQHVLDQARSCRRVLPPQGSAPTARRAADSRRRRPARDRVLEQALVTRPPVLAEQRLTNAFPPPAPRHRPAPAPGSGRATMTGTPAPQGHRARQAAVA